MHVCDFDRNVSVSLLIDRSNFAGVDDCFAVGDFSCG